MCEQCAEMEELAALKKIDLGLIQRLIDENKLDLYAGNCYPNEISKHMDIGRYYTINTYYHCSKCDKFFYVGFCLYGLPIIKEVDKDKAADGALRFEWGFTGSFFEKGISMGIARQVINHGDFINAPVWSCLIDAFNYGTATPVQALISTLKMLWKRMQKGQTVDLYFPAETQKQEINISTFDDIMKKYFSEFVLGEIKN